MSKMFLKTASLVSAVFLMGIVEKSQSAEQIDGDVGEKDRSNLMSTRMNEVAAMAHLRDDLVNNNNLDWRRMITLLKSEKDYIERGYGKRTRHGPSPEEIRRQQLEAQRQAALAAQRAAEAERQRLAAIEAERQRQISEAQRGIAPDADSALEEEREKLRQQSAEALRATGAAASSRPADVAAEGDFVTSPDDE